MVAWLILTLGLLGVLLLLSYLFLAWNLDYWKKRGVPGPKPALLYGTFPNIVKHKQSMANDMLEVYKQYRDDEDFVGVFLTRTPQVMILNPQLAHRVLVTEFNKFHDNESSTWFDFKKDIIMSNNVFTLNGDKWKDSRKEVMPAFTAKRVKAIFPVTQQICNNLTHFIKGKCHEVDAKDLSLRYTSEVVTDCVLGIKADSLSENPSPILKWTKTLFQQKPMYMAYAFAASLWPTLRSIYRAKFFRKDTEDFFLNLVNSAFDLRRKENVDRVDFVNFMLKLQEKKMISNDDMFSHSMTFLIEGFENIALVIASCLYQLAKYPKCQEKLRNEIESCLIEEDGELEFDQLDSMPYIEQCVHESIRIIPPILFSTKLCTQPCEFINKNGNKLLLEPHQSVIIPFYAFHHDEQYFPQPSEFIPERFSPESGGSKKFRDMGVYFGFSDGPRICMGMKFAMVQTKAAIAEIIRNFEVKLNPKTKTDNRLHPTDFFGTVDGGIWLDFKERNKGI